MLIVELFTLALAILMYIGSNFKIRYYNLKLRELTLTHVVFFNSKF